MVLTLIQQGLGLRPREKRALCGKMTTPRSLAGAGECLYSLEVCMWNFKRLFPL